MEQKTSILVAGADQPRLRARASHLQAAGYDVIQAGAGREALRLAREMQPHLMLLDADLSDISGVEVSQRIKADPELDHVVVILLGGTPESDAQAHRLASHADAFLTGTIADDELLAQVAAFLRIQQTERRLRASEARYRAIFENAPIGIYRTTPEGQILMANPALVEMLGYDSFEELAERDLESEAYYQPDYPRSAFKRRIERDGYVRGLESAWRRKDGSTLFVRENARAVMSAQGYLVAYQGTVEDVTERVQRTKRLERLNTVLDAIGDVNQVIVRERDPKALIAAVCQLLSQAGAYRTIRIALWANEGELLQIAQANLGDGLPHVVERLQDGELEPWEIGVLSQDGVWVARPSELGYLAPVDGGDTLVATQLEHAGTRHGLITVSMPEEVDVDDREKALLDELAGDIAFALHDIALERARQEAAMALREVERRQSLILNAIREHCVYHNTSLEIQWANQSAADSVGLTVEELVGRHCYEIWAQRQEPCPGCPVLKARETGKPQETEQTTPDGRVWFVRGYPIIDEGSGGQREIEGLVEFTQDITEARAAERALRESEKRYRVLFESTGTATCVFDRQGVIQVCNQNFAALAGLPRQAIEGLMTWSDFVTADDLERMEHYHQQRNEGTGDPPSEYSFTFIDAQGQESEILLNIGLIEGTGERVASLTNVTPLKQAEEALRQSEQRYRTLFESSPESITLLDLEGTVLDCNRAAEAIAGTPRAEMLGKPFTELEVLDADDLPRYAAVFAQLLDGQEVAPLEIETSHGDGESRWWEAFPVPIIRGETVQAIQVIARDITERRRAAQELRESKQRFELALRGADLGTWDWDVQTDEVQFNDRWADMLGYRPDDIEPHVRSWEDLVHPDDLPRVLATLNAHLEGETPFYETEHRMQHRSGEWLWILDRGKVIERDRQGRPLRACGTHLNITERKRLERELRQQERLAAVGQLAGGIAHDFNNILASIILYAQQPLRGKALSTNTQRAFETILEESHRAAELIQQVLDFSRSAMMETNPTNLVTLVEETVTLLRRTIPESIRLATAMTPLPCIVQADATRMHQVLMNLALNARDAMPLGGDLRIRVERIAVGDEDPPLAGMSPGAWAHLSVSDTGSGMTEEVREHLFEPFFTTKEEGKGTGLGLAQVYGIVKQHQGFIDVETAIGAGTTFSIFLPLVDDQEEETKDGEGRPLKGHGETILVVEDAERLCYAIKAGLESVGYYVLTAAHGLEALEIASRQDIDLVLTDVVMPRMGGEALLRELRAMNAQMKVIAMTGHVMDTDVQSLRAVGFADALPKPFSMEELTNVVRDALGD